MNLQELLNELDACKEAKYWAQGKTIEEVVKTCDRGDWLLWLAQKVGLDLRTLTLAKARCAKTVIHLMNDERSIKAVEVAERFGMGNATNYELAASSVLADSVSADSAADSAYAAYAAAAAYDDYDAYAAAAAAAAAADSAAAAAAAASYAASADDCAAYSAFSCAFAAFYASNSDAKEQNQKQTADICREIFGKELIKLVNKKLKL